MIGSLHNLVICDYFGVDFWVGATKLGQERFSKYHFAFFRIELIKIYEQAMFGSKFERRLICEFLQTFVWKESNVAR